MFRPVDAALDRGVAAPRVWIQRLVRLRIVLDWVLRTLQGLAATVLHETLELPLLLHRYLRHVLLVDCLLVLFHDLQLRLRYAVSLFPIEAPLLYLVKSGLVEAAPQGSGVILLMLLSLVEVISASFISLFFAIEVGLLVLLDLLLPLLRVQWYGQRSK